jgi:chemotaxis protein CheC
MRYAMVVYTGFRMKKNSIQGYLVMVLSVVSLEKLLEEIDNWANAEIERPNVSFSS